jgi:hypothetical protein
MGTNRGVICCCYDYTFAIAPHICGSSVWILSPITILAHITNFGKFRYSLFRLSYTGGENEILNFDLSSATNIFSVIQNGLLPNKSHKFNIRFLTRACLNLVKHFKSKLDFHLVWRYIYD